MECRFRRGWERGHLDSYIPIESAPIATKERHALIFVVFEVKFDISFQTM
jgi:hypothetical protein